MTTPDNLDAAAAAADNQMGTNPVGGSTASCAAPAVQAAPSSAPGLFVAPIIKVVSPPYILVKKPYIPPANVVRTPVMLTTDVPGEPPAASSGTLSVTSLNGASVDFYTAATGGAKVANLTFTGAALAMGVNLYAEGISPSTIMNDLVLDLSLSSGTRTAKPPVQQKVTVVEVTLDICHSRTQHNVLPTELSVGDKTTTGRYVHVQDVGTHGYHHGRALLIVRKANPTTFPGTLELRGMDAKLQLFNEPDEVAASGQAIAALPHTIPNGTIPATGQKFWVEGAAASGALADTGLKLGVTGLGHDGDFIKMTVVQFSNLTATIEGTPPNTTRMGNGPVPKHVYAVAGAVPKEFSENGSDNKALVLIANSVTDAKQIRLSVSVVPAGTPVQWSVLRDTRPGPGDGAEVIAASPRDHPTLSPDGADPLKQKLLADAVGSFNIRPFVDCNGNNKYDYYDYNDDPRGKRIDREPFIIMNLVLVRVRSIDNSRSGAWANNVIFDFNPPASPATAVRVHTGDFDSGPTAACYNVGAVEVIGGGGRGRVGLDRVFAGWVNNELTVPTSTTVPPGEDVVSVYFDQATAMTHRRQSIWTSVNPGTVFGPLTVPGPAGMSGPVLDTTNFGSEGTGGNTCVGTEGRVGPPIEIYKRDIAVGQVWRIEMWDSPGDGCPLRHEFFPGRLWHYWFNIDFRSDLCFWTNIDATPAPSAAPGGAACRLYSSVITNYWSIRISIDFDLVTGAGRNIGTSITMPTKIERPATPAETVGVEVRFPISLNLLAIDART